MKLTSLFKDALESEDADARSRAVAELDSGDTRLVQLATNDVSAKVRAAAAARLADMDRLQGIANKDSDAQVRTAASDRLQALLSDTAGGAVRLAWLEHHASEALAATLARNGSEPAIRLAALTRLTALRSETLEALCAEVATSDSSADVRLTAAQQVFAPALVERLLAAAKGHDKRVLQVARERLKHMREAEKHDAKRQHLCEVLEELAANPDGDTSLLVDVSLAARLQVIENEWQQLARSDSPSEEHLARFAAAAGKVREIVDARDRIDAEQAGLQQALKALQVRAADDDVPAEIDRLLQQWQSLQAVTDAQTHAFENLAGSVRGSHNAAVRDRQRRIACERVLENHEKRLHGNSPLASGQLKALEKDWSRQKLPGDKAASETLTTRYRALHDSLRDSLQRQQGDSASAAGDLAKMLDKLDSCIEAGELQQAISLFDKSRSRVEKAALDAARRTAIDKRLQAFALRIADLKRWRHWGTDKARENLYEAAEALVGRSGKIAALAQDVHALREQWKKLDHADGPARQELWQRFNETCEKAYAPCKAHFDDQSAKRAENLVTKKALCERLTALVNETDWEAPDWRTLVKVQRDTTREFFAAGPVDRKARKGIDNAFRKANESLESQLGSEREKELVRRRGLIRQVQALSEEQDLRVAISAAQRAQKGWSPTVQSERKLEEQLWREFRVACDAVFERRRESIESSNAAASAEEEKRREVCDSIVALGKELEALSPADNEFDTHLNQLAGRFKAATGEWRSAPRGARSKAEPRYRDACRAFEKLLKEKRQAAAAKEREVLAQRAAICARLERAALAGGDTAPEPGEVAEACEQWNSLPAVRGALDKALQSRYELALAACQREAGATDRLTAALDANHEERLRLCLELEIAADIESPEEFAKARMQHRIAQLSNALASGGAGDVNKTAAVRALADSWYQAGPAPVDEQDTLEQRFRRAMEAAGEPVAG